jgi:N-acetylglutamate synthase-like GNAT family acetyltransferase
MAVIRKPNALDLAGWRALLAAETLRTEDLGDPQGFWLVAHESGALVAGVGAEFEGDSALLRSLVVAPALRGGGLGTALVDAVADEARKRGCAWLYCFATGSGKFFGRIGFRETTPDELAAALPNAPQVRLYRRLKWLETEQAFRRDLGAAA